MAKKCLSWGTRTTGTRFVWMTAGMAGWGGAGWSGGGGKAVVTEQEIKVLLVDENREALSALSKQLNFSDLTVIGEAGFGPVAFTWASQLQPDIVLVALEEPI